MSWFEVDRNGLRQLLDGRDKSFVLRELIQNAWDEPGVTRCCVHLHKENGSRDVQLVVEDDAPEGFYDLKHSYTMFAHTRKRSSPTKRGRFNLGEKEVLALCSEARIVTTTGGVEFLADGKRKQLRRKRDSGSVFEAWLPMTRDEMAECERAVFTFIPPAGIHTTVNAQTLPPREPIASVDATLATEFEDKDGSYRPSRRKTTINVYEPLTGEKPMIYEMGLPIIEIEGKWHYDIQQRVPMTSDRDNVRPSFLQDCHAEVLNALAAELDDDEASANWVQSATEDDRIEKEAFEAVLHKRFGENVVTHSVDDLEANHAAQAADYTVLSGGHMSGRQWAQAKRFQSVEPSTAKFVTAKPQFSPDGDDFTIPPEKQTDGMKRVVKYCERIAKELMGVAVAVHVVRSRQNFCAWYGNWELSLNVRKLGNRFFDMFPENLEGVNALLIHELAHQHESDHLSRGYAEACCELGAKLTGLALTKKRLFR